MNTENRNKNIEFLALKIKMMIWALFLLILFHFNVQATMVVNIV